MPTQKDYWEDFIVDWDRSAYDEVAKDLSWVERLATNFRSPLRFRFNFSVEFLAPRVSDMRVFDIGCGTGRLCAALIGHGAASVTGTDISSKAVAEGNTRFAQMAIDPARYSFLNKDLSEMDLNEVDCDLVVGLGIFQYLDDHVVEAIMKMACQRQFFFEFHEDTFNVVNLMHRVYRNLKWMSGQTMPDYNLRTRADMGKIFEGLSDKPIYYHHEQKQSFITNFEDVPGDWMKL